MAEREKPRNVKVFIHTVPGAKVKVEITPLSTNKAPKPEKNLKYPVGLIESLMPLIRDIDPKRSSADGDDDIHWTQIQKDAPLNIEQALTLLKKKRLNPEEIASVVLDRYYHQQIQMGEITKEELSAYRTSLVSKISGKSKKN